METPLQLGQRQKKLKENTGHNPCFSGNSFATRKAEKEELARLEVTILVLVETPLQQKHF